MRTHERLPMVAALSLFALGAAACGPTRVALDPRNVVNVSVHPASGQALFCPGDPFQVEVVAKLKDGSSCSSTDRARGCMGEKDAVIDPDDVRLEGTNGGLGTPREKFIWIADANPLTTADTGLTLRGWIEKVVDGQNQKTMVGEALLKPVYQCLSKEKVYSSGPRGSSGENGGSGPDLVIAVTTLSTPYFPGAALVRVESGTTRDYFISATTDEAIRITSVGQPGSPGKNGENGKKGEDGKDADASAQCAKGGNGTDGQPGEQGGAGGNGGPGGKIKIILDEAAADKLRGRILVASRGGGPGSGGMGGLGGFGGHGGSGGMTGPDCMDTRGASGKNGENGKSGPDGAVGPDGPPPVYETAPRAKLFGTEMGAITRIEAAKAAK